MKYVELELAKRRGKKVDASEKEEKDQVDELYVVPDHLKVCIKPHLTCLLRALLLLS
jgi:Hepatocellular carcinoma-associated antigen 59